jgi:4-hydroxybenzoate polyprenyltransferase
LYVGFIGRILLKDFRDVVGDAMFGKRTFLVRHGRRATCALSVGCWTLGTALLVGATPARSTVFVVAECTLSAAAIALVVRLARPLSHRTEERVISAVAILGRTVLTVLFFHLSATHPVVNDLLNAAVTLLTLSLAAQMLWHGPLTPWSDRRLPTLTGWSTSRAST